MRRLLAMMLVLGGMCAPSLVWGEHEAQDGPGFEALVQRCFSANTYATRRASSDRGPVRARVSERVVLAARPPVAPQADSSDSRTRLLEMAAIVNPVSACYTPASPSIPTGSEVERAAEVRALAPDVRMHTHPELFGFKQGMRMLVEQLGSTSYLDLVSFDFIVAASAGLEVLLSPRISMAPSMTFVHTRIGKLERGEVAVHNQLGLDGTSYAFISGATFLWW